jgi:hypothetical protein
MDRGQKHYVGLRTQDGCRVTVHDDTGNPACPLDPRFDLRQHSPTGYEWGYAGSGPAQLSLAILADALGDADNAQKLYQDFKFSVVARLSGDKWSLSEDAIREAVAGIEASRGRRK